MAMTKGLNPLIVFSFSKRECETYALEISQLSFNDEAEKEIVQKVFMNGISLLSQEDRELPQIVHVLPLLRRGIGIHHSGLLPILKEITEILFQEGLLKVLFATETFSIGLNMPAKTVVFTSCRKFDGIAQRWLTPSEFIQMSGRAGRRGLDERGVVIVRLQEEVDQEVLKSMMRADAEPLDSAFYLGFSMLLNLLRVAILPPEEMLLKSFVQFQRTSQAAGLENGVTRCFPNAI